MLYCEYNLMLFACGELSSPVTEFKGYFDAYYPCLNSYISLLAKDMLKIYRKLMSAFERGKLPMITYL